MLWLSCNRTRKGRFAKTLLEPKRERRASTRTRLIQTCAGGARRSRLGSSRVLPRRPVRDVRWVVRLFCGREDWGAGRVQHERAQRCGQRVPLGRVLVVLLVLHTTRDTNRRVYLFPSKGTVLPRYQQPPGAHARGAVYGRNKTFGAFQPGGRSSHVDAAPC